MYLIVGAGLTGAVIAERLATQKNKKVLVIDKRDHIAGNIFDYVDENGVMVHKYGPHAFHTNNKVVWDYLSQFTKWHLYNHRVKVIIEGIEATLPFNLDTIYELFPQKQAEKYENKLIETFGYSKKIPILELVKTDDKDLKFLGEYVYKHIFVGYTTKQWGLKPEELDGSVTARVPVYISRDNRYFQDTYQAIPKDGYTKMVENILSHPNIEVNLNTKFQNFDTSGFEKIIFTGMIDEYYDFKYGKLPYRSLEFDLQTVDSEYFQSLSQINYPNNYDFTRITEFKYFLDQKTDKTTIALEYPAEYKEGVNDPYYPIPSDLNQSNYEKYKKLAQDDKKTIFAGRLANYVYLNMDQIVENALKIEGKIL